MELIELINLNFKSNEITEIGRAIFRDFDLHDVSGTRSLITLSDRRSAEILVEYTENRKKLDTLIEFLIQIDGLYFLGTQVELKGIEGLMERLSTEGLVYSRSKRKLVKTKEDPLHRVDWGALKEGRSYSVTIVSLDICNNSRLVKTFGDKKMKKLYSALWQEIHQRLAPYNGRIWHWAGDGGIIAFAMKNHAYNGVRFAMELQSVLPLFLMEPQYPIKEDLSLRLGLHSGKLIFSLNTGTIVSEVINYASHLEKKHCPPGQVAISEKTLRELPKSFQRGFVSTGIFEGQEAFASVLLSGKRELVESR